MYISRAMFGHPNVSPKIPYSMPHHYLVFTAAISFIKRRCDIFWGVGSNLSLSLGAVMALNQTSNLVSNRFMTVFMRAMSVVVRFLATSTGQLLSQQQLDVATSHDLSCRRTGETLAFTVD